MEARISGTTKLFGLIGSPVSHSASPAMQNYGFQACGVDGAYLAFDIKEEEVPEFIKSMRLLNIQGCNVTMPNKTAAAQNMDELSPAAELIGAVNTIVNRDGKLYGHITDGEGFVANLKDHGISVEGKDIVIFGAGGAATAIQVQCALDGAKLTQEIHFLKEPRRWLRRSKPKYQHVRWNYMIWMQKIQCAQRLMEQIS